MTDNSTGQWYIHESVQNTARVVEAALTAKLAGDPGPTAAAFVVFNEHTETRLLRMSVGDRMVSYFQSYAIQASEGKAMPSIDGVFATSRFSYGVVAVIASTHGQRLGLLTDLLLGLSLEEIGEYNQGCADGPDPVTELRPPRRTQRRGKVVVGY